MEASVASGVLYIAAWIAATLVSAILAAVFARRSRLFLVAFVAIFVSLPTFVVYVVVAKQVSSSEIARRQARETEGAARLCDEVTTLRQAKYPSSVTPARVIFRNGPEQQPIDALAVVRQLRESPGFCSRTRLRSVRNELPSVGASGVSGELSEAVCGASEGVTELKPKDYLLQFVLEERLALGGFAGADLRKYRMSLVDVEANSTVAAHAVVNGTQFSHLSRGCLDTASNVADFITEALPQE